MQTGGSTSANFVRSLQWVPSNTTVLSGTVEQFGPFCLLKLSYSNLLVQTSGGDLTASNFVIKVNGSPAIISANNPVVEGTGILRCQIDDSYNPLNVYTFEQSIIDINLIDRTYHIPAIPSGAVTCVHI